MNKYSIEEVDSETLRLYIYENYNDSMICTDIIEGPNRFIMNWILQIVCVNEGLKIRKVK